MVWEKLNWAVSADDELVVLMSTWARAVLTPKATTMPTIAVAAAFLPFLPICN